MEALADVFYDLPRNHHYVFDLVHFILTIQSEVGDLSDDERTKLSKERPFSLWLSSMIACFAGTLLVNPLIGEPALDAFEDCNCVFLATLVWILIFYVEPVLNLTKKFYAKVPLYALKALYYPKKIIGGIKLARKEFKRNNFAQILIPVLKGNGSGFIKPITRFLRSSGKGDLGFETVSPSITTKYVLIATLINLYAPRDIAYLLSVALMLAMKVGPLFGLEVAQPINIIEDKLFNHIPRALNAFISETIGKLNESKIEEKEATEKKTE